MAGQPPRALPALTEETRPFWTGGARGELLIARCQDCKYYIHPPAPVCARCMSRAVRPEAVSGKATVFTYTINHHRWVPQLEVPYAIAIVELPEQSGLRLTTNIVNCPVERVAIGLPVTVVFQQEEDLFLPLFEPI